ncbi:inactive peptidyl-prolyl cis-trans isomerase shutdown [Sitodiplosis mosellana]|uniref:inactive peptidyl-prolyl cis-trans isomerase shutdown n=1 Tax=Sitodiplosis mosellana TaxID=263140 RepID=UPI002443B58E|nr:inactive peptidyl-prolyl cis-trans isomerase shutdown [Sitodiplosis mosellana]
MQNDMDRVVELEEGIRFNDLLSGGASFNINHKSMAETIDQDIFDEVGSGDENEDEEDLDIKLSPWKKSFAELKLSMVQVPNEMGSVYKRIITKGIDEVMNSPNCRIRWTFSMFFEGEPMAFDSSSNPVTVQKIDLILGLQIAAESMQKKEEAQFVIDYKLMFGEIGCPPRIKPKADVLLVAKMIDFIDTGDENACDSLSQEDRRKFAVLKDKVIEMMKKLQDHFRNKRYRYAINVGQTAIRNLEMCQVANEDEQTEQQKFLNDLYIQLTTCLVKTEDWKKCCTMVNELRRRTNISRNVPVMLNEAIALSHIEDDYKRSINLLRNAQKLEPHNELVNSTLDEVLAKEEKYRKQSQDMWRKALEVKSKADAQKE